MTIKKFKEIIKKHNIPDNVELIMNDGGGGELNYEFPVEGVFYSRERKEIAFVSEILYARDYLGDDNWVCLNVNEDEKEDFFIQNFIEKTRKSSEFKIEDYIEYLDFLNKNKRMVNPQNLGLKLLVFADLKETFEMYEEQIFELINNSGNFDLCILIGDICDWHLKQLLKVISKEKIVAVPSKYSPYINVYEENGVCDISSTVFHKEGVKIHGISSYEHKLCESQSYCLNFVRISPYKNVDILITCDEAFVKDRDTTKKPGFIGITDYIYSNIVKYHIHKGNETYQSQYANGTKEISVNKFAYVEI